MYNNALCHFVNEYKADYFDLLNNINFSTVLRIVSFICHVIFRNILNF